ncbi:helix-turn-helix domain-containing protein [Streptomyces andamanensis]|uniref:Helix-turn-helix domain-containing protein n=1 Tax=Streptomyces andamanensis TaxID=1565035 RepID=A0ABV8TIF2_9ACTN
MRGVAVLRALTEAGGTLSPSALERATGLARATVDRVTATLARMGYVRLTGRDTVLAPPSDGAGQRLSGRPAPARPPRRAGGRPRRRAGRVGVAGGPRPGRHPLHPPGDAGAAPCP